MALSWLKCIDCIRNISVEKTTEKREKEEKRKRGRKKKVPLPMAKTWNYVYYAIRRAAHFAFCKSKTILSAQERQTHTTSCRTIDVCLYLRIKCSFSRSFGLLYIQQREFVRVVLIKSTVQATHSKLRARDSWMIYINSV